jgi:phage baseplate assembly protein W
VADLGTDLSCIQDLTDEMATVSGRLGLAQALARRIITPRGALIDDANYGFDITDFLDNDVLPATLAQVGGNVDAEFLKDQRVLASTTTVITSGQKLVTTSVVQDADGPFSLVLSVGDVTVEILKVQS